ncbi:MAG TPA: DUF1376 domain-containing protein [Flavobacteriales bacterium]|nr:DUF1376 domain-containing protein [Methylococcaceae bacterium]HHZ95402.1 DUF1376 domain-containing protein [Flavobacteriales bacterium]
MHYYQFNIGDYVSSTQHLDENEDLAYRRMLDIYYSKELPLPEDQKDIARLIRMRTHTESIAIVLHEFFTLKKDGYHCIRADKEILAFQSKSDKARKSAEARWNKNKDLPKEKVDANALRTQSEGKAKAMLNTKQETLNTKQETLKDNTSFINDGFDHWWSSYKKKADKKKALQKFKLITRGFSDDRFSEFVNMITTDCKKRFVDTEKEFVPNATTYLNGERWNDEIIGSN